jgi:hypothetical protein
MKTIFPIATILASLFLIAIVTCRKPTLSHIKNARLIDTFDSDSLLNMKRG